MMMTMMMMMMVPEYMAGIDNVIGSKGRSITSIAQESKCELKVSAIGRFFPGLQDRIVIMGALREECGAQLVGEHLHGPPRKEPAGPDGQVRGGDPHHVPHQPFGAALGAPVGQPHAHRRLKRKSCKELLGLMKIVWACDGGKRE